MLTNVSLAVNLWILRDDLLLEEFEEKDENWTEKYHLQVKNITCESSGMVSSTRVLAKRLLLLLVLPPLPSFSRWLNCLRRIGIICDVKWKSLTLGNDNLQDFPHFLSSGRTLNSWNRLLPHLILYLVHFGRCSYETKCICDQTRCQGTRALCLTPLREICRERDREIEQEGE